MPDKPTVLLMHRLIEFAGPPLEDRHRVLRDWEAPAPEDLAQVRAVLVVGEADLPKARLEALPALGLIAAFASGYECVDVPWARARGLEVTHAPGVNQEDVADLAIGLMIAARRGIVDGDRQVRAGGWRAGAKVLTPSLTGLRVGMVGLGRIGEAVARRCDAMRMPVAWWGPRDKPGEPRPRANTLLALAQDSDVLVVACRADETNRHLVDAPVLDALGPRGLLVNVARGRLVDEDALIAALRSGRLGGAALDVFAEEPTPPARWADVPGAVLTPHMAGATFAAAPAMLDLLKANLAAFFAGEAVLTPAA